MKESGGDRMEPLAVLREEHGLLRSVLDAQERCLLGIERGGSPCDLSRFVLFLRAFVESFHGPKEDEILFEIMGQYGFSLTSGPLALMTGEHQEVCRRLDFTATALSQGKSLRDPSLRAAVSALRSVNNLLRYHIEMEEGVLYPTAETELPPEALELLSTRLRADSGDSRNKLCCGALKRLAGDLQTLYPARRPRRLVASL